MILDNLASVKVRLSAARMLGKLVTISKYSLFKEQPNSIRTDRVEEKMA